MGAFGFIVGTVVQVFTLHKARMCAGMLEIAAKGNGAQQNSGHNNIFWMALYACGSVGGMRRSCGSSVLRSCSVVIKVYFGRSWRSLHAIYSL